LESYCTVEREFPRVHLPSARGRFAFGTTSCDHLGHHRMRPLEFAKEDYKSVYYHHQVGEISIEANGFHYPVLRTVY
jgi:hypothetical protein